MKHIRKIGVIIGLIGIFLVVTGVILYSTYLQPVSTSNEGKIIELEKGMSSRKIGQILYENNLIKDDGFFYIYLRVNKIKDLQAGTYKLSPNMSLKEIVETLRKGKVYQDDTIRITFKEGINYRGLARVIENNTNNTYDDVLAVLNDEAYIKSLIDTYWFITDEILNDKIYYSLEGYLFPDTYEFRSKEVTVPEIFKRMLDKMDDVLTPYKHIIENDKYTVHELLTLASIAELEVYDTQEYPDNRKNVISVFVNRLNKKISLGSDITTRYGIKLDETRPLTKSEYATANAYNTRNTNMLGLPPSPICMVSKDSIIASIERIETNYLYFIANINTKETFFFETSNAFEAKKKELGKVNGGY